MAWPSLFLTGIIFAGQLYEMISGGTQTDKLVDYAKTQAQAASDIAQASDDFTDSAKWMEEHTEDAANAMQDSVDAASANTRTTIRNAQNAFREEQRAWVGVGDSQLTQFESGKPIRMEIIFFNSGKTPAIKVHVVSGFNLYASPISGPSTEDIRKNKKELPDNPRQALAPQGKMKLVIGDITPIGQNGAISRAYLQC